ncbi:MAG: hypothetical protein WCD45_05095 [Gallionella sp.]
MGNFLESLPDGWTIYLWLVIGAIIIIAVLFWLRWGAKNEQFDEDIKYVLFDEQDREKMSPEEFAKSRVAIAAQIESRKKFLAKKAEQSKSNV